MKMTGRDSRDIILIASVSILVGLGLIITKNPNCLWGLAFILICL